MSNEIVKLPGSEIERAAANVIERAGKNIADGATSFGSAVFNGLIGDRVREWRTRNVIRAAAKTAEILKENGVSLEMAKSLPMLEFYSIFEGMSEQDDPDVADLWAGLLASRMSTAEEHAFDRSIPQILASLNGDEARVLKFLREYVLLENNLPRVGAPIYLGIPPGKEKEVEEASAAHERIVSLRIERITALRDETFGSNKPDNYDAAVETLKNKRLVYVHRAHTWHQSFTKREYFSDSGSVEILDQRKISDELHRLNRETIGLSNSGTDSGAKLFSEFQGMSVNYRLTDAGKYLLIRCEV